MTAKSSPLGINVVSSLLSNTGMSINPVTKNFIGESKTNTSYYPGKIINDTCLRLLTYAINDGYIRGPGGGNSTLSDTTYNNLISIGSTTLPALGNSKPPTYVAEDPSGGWVVAGAPATTGYSISGNTDQGQAASWLPYSTENLNKSVTQWGYLRLHALQSWNEFNWNGISPSASSPLYNEFCASFMSAKSYMRSINPSIHSIANANTFLDGVYSNMNDLISADITGISQATYAFGKDLENLGKTINLSKIDAFGLPSVLLATIIKCNGMTTDLALLLVSVGITSEFLSELIKNDRYRPSIEIERKIYNVFTFVVGQNLDAVLASLHCRTIGLESLVDLLDVKKLFPQSYETLTVPMYNSTVGLPTNSKTYYLIYSNNGINSSLTTPEMNDYVGEQIPYGEPPVGETVTSPDNYVLPKKGFGSYLRGILPDDQAIAAGALQFSFRQIKKINQVDIKKLAKVVTGIETVSDLPLTQGTSKPTSQDAIDSCLSVIALGSGPNGTYTMSDFFGCMTGLPYPWELIYNRISQLQTTKLYNIYQQLYLATTWKQATATVNYSVADVGGTLYYTPTSISVSNSGGGYGRGTASAPSVTLSNGGIATAIIGTDDTSLGTNGTFGRIITITLDSPGPATTTIPTAIVQSPPIDVLPVSALGQISNTGTNYPSGTTGWTNPMNTVVQQYIEQANAEIENIKSTALDISAHLQAYWNGLGSQLMIEQRTRYNAFPPVSIPRESYFISSPSVHLTFVDDIAAHSLDTLPHGAAQSLESIADLSTVGGQSLVALLRQERNRSRLMQLGIELDSSIPDDLSSMQKKTLLTNGTLSDAGVNNTINGFTNPAWQTQILDNSSISPLPRGSYVPTTTELVGDYIVGSGVKQGDITPLLEDTQNPVVGTYVPVGNNSSDNIGLNDLIQPPVQLDPSNIPEILDPAYISSTLIPSATNVQQAINQVTVCNCDCWIK